MSGGKRAISGNFFRGPLNNFVRGNQNYDENKYGIKILSDVRYPVGYRL